MEKYEKFIGLKTIYLTLIRRFKLIILIFIPVAIAAFIVTQFVMTKTYSSSATTSNANVYNQERYNNVMLAIKNSDMYSVVAESLKTKEVKHSSGSEITTAEIQSGISFSSFSSTSSSLTISFQSKDSTIVQAVAQEYAEQAVAKVGEKYAAYGMKITGEASASKKNSSENKYLLIALAADVVLACGVPFVYEIFADEVYDKDDINALGGEAFELKASKAK